MSTSSAEDEANDDADISSSTKRIPNKEDIKMWCPPFKAHGHEFNDIAVPRTHAIVLKSDLARWKKDSDALKAQRKLVNRQRFIKNASGFSRLYCVQLLLQFRPFLSILLPVSFQ